MHQPELLLPVSAQGDARWSDFVRRIHARLEVEAVGLVLVNDGRVLLDCDRAVLLLAHPGGPRLAAVSGQETVDRRSNVAGAWETFAAAAGATHETLVLDGSPSPAGPIVEAAAAALIDVTEARQTVFVPILRPEEKTSAQTAPDHRPECLGWLIGERFTSLAPSAPLVRQADEVARSAATALANALQYERLPLRRLGEAIRRVRDRRALSRGAVVLLLLAATVAALTLIRVELKVEARGTLEPRERRHVFAPVEGVIVGVKVKHGQVVEAGSPLVDMRRPELDFELTRVGGELETERRRFESIQAARLRGAVSGTTSDAADRMRLTAEEEEVRQRLAGLKRQYDELVEQSKNLKVTAPLSGRVLTWDVERQLDGRPVAKGRQLLTIGRVEGPWDLELTLEDRYAGYVRKAQERGEIVEIEFVAASSAGETHPAQLTTIAARGEADEQGETTVRATAAVDAGVPRGLLHPGAAVTAKIHCGRAAVGYVWFVDVIHFVRTRILF